MRRRVPRHRPEARPTKSANVWGDRRRFRPIRPIPSASLALGPRCGALLRRGRRSRPDGFDANHGHIAYLASIDAIRTARLQIDTPFRASHNALTGFASRNCVIPVSQPGLSRSIQASRVADPGRPHNPPTGAA